MQNPLSNTSSDINGETSSEKPSLFTKDLVVTYPNKTCAVNGVSMNLFLNKVTTLIGPSGCGKTTFLRTLNRINDEYGCIYEGRVQHGDTDILSLKGDALHRLRGQKVGYVMQKPVPFSGKTILEDVTIPLQAIGIKKKSILLERAEEVLRKVFLWAEVSSRLNTLSTELSGGQQQRLCIARAIINVPDLLLLDEPCSALDPKSTFKIEELIKELKRDHTLVVVTHNMQQAQRVGDFTAFFYEGSLVEYASTRQLFNNPTEELTKHYIQGDFS